MKKILVGLLTFALILSFVGCGAKETPPDSTASKSAESKQGSGSERLSGVFMDTIKGGKYYMSATIIVKSNEQEMKIESVSAVDGKDANSMVDMGGIKMHTLLKDGQYYMLDDNAKTYQTLDAPVDNSTQMPSVADAVYTGSGVELVNGRTLPYEEYAVEDGTARYFMDGKNLYAMVFRSDGIEMVMIVNKLSKTIPAGMLELPVDYKEIQAQAFSLFGGATGQQDFEEEDADGIWPESKLAKLVPRFDGSGDRKIPEDSEDTVMILIESAVEKEATAYFEQVKPEFQKERKETHDNGRYTYMAKNGENISVALSYKNGTMSIMLSKDE